VQKRNHSQIYPTKIKTQKQNIPKFSAVLFKKKEPPQPQ